MASIIKRKNRYSVVYSYIDESGQKKQKWETFATNAEAKKRKNQIEYEQDQGTFIVPQAKTVKELLDDYTAIYGTNTWAMSTYENKRGLILNYINPIIGNMKLEDINTRVIEKYYKNLLKVKSKIVNNRKPNNEFVSAHIIREIHKLLRSAFNQAIKWELVSKNPCTNATLPPEDSKPREIWDIKTLFKALELCDDDILSLAINLAFSCTLRLGEMLALTWDCCDISDESIEAGRAYIFVNKELQRVNREILETLNGKGLMLKFPSYISRTTTALVLKEPKTPTSVRKIFLPRTVAYMLKDRYKAIQEYKLLFGEEYTDYDLVFCSPNGKPMEHQMISRPLQKLIRKHNLPHIVFHSIRHTSITYKLKLNGGDIKSVQGDSGHAQVKMVTDVYSHILDDDRQINAQRLENAFYQQHTSALSDATSPKLFNEDAHTGNTNINEQTQPPASNITDEIMLNYMLTNPEFLQKFKVLLGIGT